MVLNSVYDCTIVQLHRHHRPQGNITVVENGQTVPFDVKRIYYLYDIPGGESRGAHAHRELSQLIVAASGSFRVTLDDGKVKRSFILNRPYQGLFIKPGIWRDLDDFSSGSVCMVLASDIYKKEDYIRDYDEFIKWRCAQKISLHEFDRTFLNESFKWLNDPYIKKMTHAGDFTKEMQERWFVSLPSRKDYKIWGVCYGETPIGSAGLKIVDDNTAEFFGYIGVAIMRGKGLGAPMLALIEDKARELSKKKLILAVRQYNENAIRFYLKNGFKEYDRDADRLFMTKDLL